MHHAGLDAVAYPGEYQLIDDEGYPGCLGGAAQQQQMGSARCETVTTCTRLSHGRRTLRLLMEGGSGKDQGWAISRRT